MGASLVDSQVPPHATEPGAPAVVERAPSKTVNEALVPIRVFPVGGVKRGAVKAAFQADGVGFLPYGFVKVTAVEDSSEPTGDDFPLPGFLCDTGPDGAPEFHIKARSTRVGANFEWYDENTKWTITGKVEADFEGNFNRSDNRNISSVRSSNPSLRVAWGRLDYAFDAKNTFSAAVRAGLDAVRLLDAAESAGDYRSRDRIRDALRAGPADARRFHASVWRQDRGIRDRAGVCHRSAGSGLTPSAANVSNQLGYGERQGPDSNRPEVQARLVGQWQLDPAKGVPPAQVIVSGFDGKRTAIVLASAVPAAYQSAFSKGVSASSRQDGWDAEWQLPTRWFTLVGKVYGGSDLRWFFAGQLYSFFNDTAGLSDKVTVASEDGSSNVVLGRNANGEASGRS